VDELMASTGTFLAALWSVFAVVDPVGVVPTFVVLTEKRSTAERERIARRASLVGAALLIVFTLFGHVVFRVFGIHLAAFRVAGGLLLLLTALDMFRAKVSACRCTQKEEREGREKHDPAIVPLAVPLLAGPGAIATVMVLSATGGPVMKVSVAVAVIVTFAVGYVAFRGAPLVQRMLGASGIAVLQRVMGLLLAAMAVQFLLRGAKELWAS
jgi:multiple antibiotic resistance protein